LVAFNRNHFIELVTILFNYFDSFIIRRDEECVVEE